MKVGGYRVWDVQSGALLGGAFPGECKEFMRKYMECLKKCGSDNGLCRAESKAYLQCRMDKELMTPESFKKLGYHDKTVTHND